MTKKQREIQRMLPMLKDREVKVWLTGQRNERKVVQAEPFIEGTVDGTRLSETYLTIRNGILWNGKFFADYDISIGTIAKITLK